MIKRAGMGLALAVLRCGMPQAGLISHTMRVWHLMPDTGTVFAGPVDVVAGPGVEVTLLAGIYNVNFSDVSLTDSELLITFPNSCCGGFGNTSFNGLHVLDLSGNGWVGVSYSSNFGFPSGRITFDNDEVFVNFAGLNPNPATDFLIITVSTPEPSTWICVAGAAAVFALRRRFTRTSA